MTARGRYVAGLAAVAAAAVALSFVLPPGDRRGLRTALGLALLSVAGIAGARTNSEEALNEWAIALGGTVTRCGSCQT